MKAPELQTPPRSGAATAIVRTLPGSDEGASAPSDRGIALYSAMRLSPVSGRIRTVREAGFAGTPISSPLKGRIIRRAFLAGFRATSIFKRPGSVKKPTARLLVSPTTYWRMAGGGLSAQNTPRSGAGRKQVLS